MANRTRKQRILLYLSDDERYILDEKWKLSEMKSRSAFLRHLIIYGYVYDVNYDELNPDVVDMIGFCTKNPTPMLPHMELLKPYGQHWFVTITPYGRDIEPNVPDKALVMDAFRKLSDIIGKSSINWRYDPIIINDTLTVEKHIETFEEMAERLSGYTDICVRNQDCHIVFLLRYCL